MSRLEQSISEFGNPENIGHATGAVVGAAAVPLLADFLMSKYKKRRLSNLEMLVSAMLGAGGGYYAGGLAGGYSGDAIEALGQKIKEYKDKAAVDARYKKRDEENAGSVDTGDQVDPKSLVDPRAWTGQAVAAPAPEQASGGGMLNLLKTNM